MFSSFFSNPHSPIKQIGPNELDRLPEGTRLVDVREPHEFHEDHLPKAELVPLGTLAQAALGWERSAPVLVICRSGGRSSRGANALVELGFKYVMNLQGGMLAARCERS